MPNPEAWAADPSEMIGPVTQRRLGKRMKAGKGKKSSPLDDIRPERWTFTPGGAPRSSGRSHAGV